MELFFATNIFDDIATLSEDESFHCIKILRHKNSDPICFTDGLGFFYEGVITKADSRKCEVLIKEKRKYDSFRDYFLHVAIAPTKNIDRIEFFLEKAVEIGIDEISFLKCERSERKDVKTERIQKIALAAIKQSKKAILPKINPMISFGDFLKKDFTGDQNFIACLTDHKNYSLKEISKKQQNYLILIGPEGDFSRKEVDLAMAKGIKPLSLGNNIYRTETAGIVSCMFVYSINTILS